MLTNLLQQPQRCWSWTCSPLVNDGSGVKLPLPTAACRFQYNHFPTSKWCKGSHAQMVSDFFIIIDAHFGSGIGLVMDGRCFLCCDSVYSKWSSACFFLGSTCYAFTTRTLLVNSSQAGRLNEWDVHRGYQTSESRVVKIRSYSCCVCLLAFASSRIS